MGDRGHLLFLWTRPPRYLAGGNSRTDAEVPTTGDILQSGRRLGRTFGYVCRYTRLEKHPFRVFFFLFSFSLSCRTDSTLREESPLPFILNYLETYYKFNTYTFHYKTCIRPFLSRTPTRQSSVTLTPWSFVVEEQLPHASPEQKTESFYSTQNGCLRVPPLRGIVPTVDWRHDYPVETCRPTNTQITFVNDSRVKPGTRYDP